MSKRPEHMAPPEIVRNPINQLKHFNKNNFLKTNKK